MPVKVCRIILGVLLLNLCSFALPQAWAARDSSGFSYRIISGRKYYNAYDIARYFRMSLRKIGKYYEMRNSVSRMVFNPQKRYGSFRRGEPVLFHQQSCGTENRHYQKIHTHAGSEKPSQFPFHTLMPPSGRDMP